uniref:Uncharacterized protein n=1 Tax=Picea glauca TaxID=3330 RepID=A0A117NG97_PICGL|nr:hypothetical protein ABT39_MTgene1533 [Picea glauca]
MLCRGRLEVIAQGSNQKTANRHLRSRVTEMHMMFRGDHTPPYHTPP